MRPVPIVIRSLRPVAKLRSACALLSAAELTALLGDSAGGTKVTATEDKPEKESYTCEYGSGADKPFALIVDSSDVPTFTPQGCVDAAATAAHVKTRRVKSVGAAAVFNITKDGFGVISASKRSHGQTRSVFFSAPKTCPGPSSSKWHAWSSAECSAAKRHARSRATRAGPTTERV